MSGPIPITSDGQFNALVKSNTYVIIDFYADWCGPCKMIAPVFAQLASQETKSGRMCFVKIDVDAHRSLAQRFSVTAMPTFVIVKNGSVSETIKGANPSTLRSAVLKASADAAKGPAKMGAAFQASGRTLGSASSTSGQTQRPSMPSFARAYPSANGNSMLDMIVRFFALYFTTLFSFNAEAAAQSSPFRIGQRT